MFSPNESLEDLASGDLQYVYTLFCQSNTDNLKVPPHQLPPCRTHPARGEQGPKECTCQGTRSLRTIPESARSIRNPHIIREEAVPGLPGIANYLCDHLHN